MSHYDLAVMLLSVLVALGAGLWRRRHSIVMPPKLTGAQLCALDRHDWQCVARLTVQTPAFETPNVEVSSWRCFRTDCTAKREETWHHGVPS